jgi:hypothetical protein
MINKISSKYFIKMFTNSLKNIKGAVKNFKDEQNILPISMAKDKVKCLDFDMDKVVFKSVAKSPVKLAEVKPLNKTWLEVMEMV